MSSAKKKNNKSEKKSAAKPAQGDKKLEGQFLAALVEQTPKEDMASWSKDELKHVAAQMAQWGRVRKSGAHKVRVFTPDQKRDGWAALSTMIAVCNDDMPFIIDSLSAELAFQALNVETLFHPVVGAQREGDVLKNITAGKPVDGQWPAESHVFIRLEQLLPTDACEKLAESLSAVLTDVRHATKDWRTMLRRADDVNARLQVISGHDWDDVKEARDFLDYVKANNFTFLGYREYSFASKNGKQVTKAVANSDLGVMRSAGKIYFDQDNDAPEARALGETRWPVTISKLIDRAALVHRRVPMDVISIKIQDDDGKLTGMHVFVGLFTSSTYSCRTGEVPIVRQKVRETITRAGFRKGSHDAKALEHILEKMPRDELFQVSIEELYNLALGILRLQSKQRIALFTHLDPMRQYMSCLLYVPRDRYNTKFRLQAARILEQGIQGSVLNFFTTLDDSQLARILFTVRLGDDYQGYDHAALEARLIDMGREWDERLRHVLVDTFGKTAGTELSFIYGRAFTSAYHEIMDVTNAVHDIRHLEGLARGHAIIHVDFYTLNESANTEYRLKVYHRSKPVPLSTILPVLENMGLKAVSETPFEVRPNGLNDSIWIHDFVLTGAAGIDIPQVKKNFEDGFIAIWQGRAENDGLNSLILKANLPWHDVAVLRTYNNYMRQARYPYSRRYVEQVLDEHAEISRALVGYFYDLHDPKGPQKGDKRKAKIDDLLQAVEKLDHDRIIRSMTLLIENTLRASFFQRDKEGQLLPYIAIKLASRNIPELPLPRPFVEIYVYSARLEAIHLRGGEVARGGIRWSDRHDDFRTEVLGLMKSQMVKNTVIIPVGAKGGFIVKHPPAQGGRAALQQEAIACYKIFVKAILDLTDNNVKGKVVRPQNVVCHDGIDPYLVVAADKGTATFSDIANEISVGANFWLGDAFASGGSAGYDHKAMGITARGGWESVKRHFRELGKDIQKEAFSVIGVGDMGGDVFGNAMLLSKEIRLVAAFNHVHIFCDPNPDAKASFAERARLFKERGGWDAYDAKKLSAGGTVFERSAKSLKLSPQIKKMFGFTKDSVTPDELIHAIMRHDAELLWFGGIGTFVKASKQSHADADDKANDALRVDANELRVKVIGEGANLGMTQLARVEFARNGGMLNTDFIDNSAGVDCSDHEVNIKILLKQVMENGKMTMAARDKLLSAMTDDVADLVLRDNYQQTQSLSFQLSLAREHLGLHGEMIRAFEKDGLIKRSLEGLPDEDMLARLTRDGGSLTRPELSILTSYSKIVLFDEVVKSDIPDDPVLQPLLAEYFPQPLHKYGKEIEGHKLKREIIATQIVNQIVNRMGAAFVRSRMAKTGADTIAVVRAFVIVCHILDVGPLWNSIEAQDGKVPTLAQMKAFQDVYQTVKRAVTWFLRFGGADLDEAQGIAEYRPGVQALKASLASVLPKDMKDAVAQEVLEFTQAGLPSAESNAVVALRYLAAASDIVHISHREKAELKHVAKTYFHLGQDMKINWLREKAIDLVPENSWQSRVRSSLIDDLFHYQAIFTGVFCAKGTKNKVSYDDVREKAHLLISDIQGIDVLRLEMLVLVVQRLGHLVSGLKD